MRCIIQLIILFFSCLALESGFSKDKSFYKEPKNWIKPDKRKLTESVKKNLEQFVTAIVSENIDASRNPLNLIRWPTEDKLIYSIGQIIIHGEKVNSLLEDCHLDHVAIAVEDIEKSVALYEAIGLKFDEHREIVESQKVKTAFCPIDSKANIELLETTDENGPIAKFIKKNGPGIHHMCFRVPNVEAKQRELEEKGVKFIYEKAFVGAHECLVNFIHPKSMGGVLIEISQKMQG